jgi:hypothetical protein
MKLYMDEVALMHQKDIHIIEHGTIICLPGELNRFHLAGSLTER